MLERVAVGFDDGSMWELARQTRAESALTVVRSSAAMSVAAIAVVRAAIPEDHVVLYVLRVENCAGVLLRFVGRETAGHPWSGLNDRG